MSNMCPHCKWINPDHFTRCGGCKAEVPPEMVKQRVMPTAEPGPVRWDRPCLYCKSLWCAGGCLSKAASPLAAAQIATSKVAQHALGVEERARKVAEEIRRGIEESVLPGPPKHDPVNHPKHYTEHPSGVECIQVTEHMGFNLGNAVKYIWRCDLKADAIEDLRKAVWYVEREIARREKARASCSDDSYNGALK